MTVSTEDLAYAAGIIDGEGCIYIDRSIDNRRKNTQVNHTLRIKVAMTDFAVPEWFKETFGGYLFIKTFDNNSVNRPQAIWGITSKKALSVLEQIKPYSKIKLRQIAIAFEFDKTLLVHGNNKGRSQNVIEKREILHLKMKDANQRRG